MVRTLALASLLACGGCAAHATPAAPAPALTGTAAYRQLQRDLATIFTAPVMSRGVWGVDIRLVQSGEALFQHNADRLMMPASNMKILTLAVAAETLGWDHRFVTSLETSAPVENGVLRGDLFVRGTGDPTISTREKRATAVFEQWVQALRAAGVTSIEGRIVGDDQAFDDEGVGPGWSWDYLEAGYAAPIGALQYNENTADLTVAPGAAAGDAGLVRLAPGSGLTAVNLVRTIAGRDSGLRGSIDVRRRIDRPEIEISGTIPVDAPHVTRTVAVVNPTLFLAQAVKDALTAGGITVTGEANDIDDIAPALVGTQPDRRVLVTTASPTLLEIGTVLMKVSQNQFGETLLKAAGAKRAGLGTTAAGRAAAADVFTAWSIPRDAYVMSDGSGLSRYNYVAPSAVTAILRRMYGDPKHRDPFVSTLPIAGKDGTISTRMRKTRAMENAVAKTGSIANVRSLSGFVRTRDGETVVFAILANDFVIPAATVTWVADLAVETLANFTRR